MQNQKLGKQSSIQLLFWQILQEFKYRFTIFLNIFYYIFKLLTHDDYLKNAINGYSIFRIGLLSRFANRHYNRVCWRRS